MATIDWGDFKVKFGPPIGTAICLQDLRNGYVMFKKVDLLAEFGATTMAAGLVCFLTGNLPARLGSTRACLAGEGR